MLGLVDQVCLALSLGDTACLCNDMRFGDMVDFLIVMTWREKTQCIFDALSYIFESFGSILSGH